jgi:integrase
MSKRKRGNGEGSIFNQGGRWRGVVTLKDGGRKWFSAATRHEVADQLRDALKDQSLGLLVAPKKQTVGQFLTWWLSDVVKPSARPKTMQFYEYQTRIHLIPGLGDIPVQRLTAQRVQAFLNDRLAQKSERTKRQITARTVRHMHRTLCTALNVAVKYKVVAVNVALATDPPAAARPTVSYMSVEQARAFLETAKGDRLYALYATVLALGLRLGEGLGIAWDDIDLGSGRFNIQQALQRLSKKLYPEKSGLQLVEPKGGYSARVVTLPAVTISALRHHQALQAEEQRWAGSRWNNQWGLAFTGKLGKPLDERSVLRWFQKLLALAELPKMRLHDLRHSAVAILLAQHVNIKAISELLGHSSVAFTLQVYGHLLEGVKRETADTMNAALSGVAATVAAKPPNQDLETMPVSTPNI